MGNNYSKSLDEIIEEQRITFMDTLDDGFYYVEHEGGRLTQLKVDLSESEIIEQLNSTKRKDNTPFMVADLGYQIIRKSVGFVGKHAISRLGKVVKHKMELIWTADHLVITN